MTKIDEILNKHSQEFKAGHLDKVKREIFEAIDCVIGSTNDEYPEKATGIITYELHIRSGIRAEQRQRLNELFNGEEK